MGNLGPDHFQGCFHWHSEEPDRLIALHSQPDNSTTMTPERFRRARAVLDLRQPDLTVLLDNVHKPHNFSAILRSCDAVGIHEAHVVWTSEPRRPLHMTSGGTAKWIQLQVHDQSSQAMAHLRERGFRLVVGHLSDCAIDYRKINYTLPTALILGTELTGASDEVLDGADQHVVIPMSGMVQSLNVSVAAAVVLFEAQRQRAAAGQYATPRLHPDVYDATLFEWTHPEVAQYCTRHGRPYPSLDENGDITTSFRQ